jgi:hypothetical protein
LYITYNSNQQQVQLLYQGSAIAPLRERNEEAPTAAATEEEEEGLPPLPP